MPQPDLLDGGDHVRVAAQVERRGLRGEAKLLELALDDRLDATGQAGPARVLVRSRDGGDVAERKGAARLEGGELVVPDEVVGVADPVEEHDVARLAAVAERVDHARERRQTGTRGDEDCPAAVVLEQELALRALDVDRVAEAALPEQRREPAGLDEADEELVLVQVVRRRADAHRPLDQLRAIMADQPERRVLARLERKRRLERVDADDRQPGSSLLPSAQPSVVGVVVSHRGPRWARLPHRWAAAGGKYRHEDGLDRFGRRFSTGRGARGRSCAAASSNQDQSASMR